MRPLLPKPAMDPNATIPQKTEAARRLLAGPRQALAAGLRMLLITVDGRKTLAELETVAHGLGLAAGPSFEHLRAEGLISWTQALPEPAAERAKRLVRAKFFALDLAARMLAGQDQALRERARGVDSESSFQAWLDDCASAIGQAANGERAALFRERVAAAAD